jgi:predicted Zn-dependent protease
MKKRTYFILLIYILTTGLQGMGHWQRAYAFSVGEEREMGEELLTMVRQGFDLIDEPDVVQYINDLGQETLDIVGSQYFDYHFFVINNKELNAFAAPSGLIFFHTGLIESMNSENALVGVVAHEIGHVVSRHLANRMGKSAKINALTMLGVLVGIAIGAGPLSQALVSGSVAAGQSASLSFSRLDEEESDRLAFKWMREQQRDPEAMVEMLREIRNINRYRYGKIPQYLLTHPGPDVRMGYVQDLILFSEEKKYRKIDDFNFHRIKKRISAMTRDPVKLIFYYQGMLAANQLEQTEAIMIQYGLSQAYSAVAEYDKAEKSLREVISFFPSKTILKTDLAVIFMKTGRYQEALALLLDARKKNRQNAYTIYNLAQAHEKNGRPNEAIKLYEELTQLIPDYTKVYFQIGNIKSSQGDKGESHYNLGIYYWYEGDFSSAKHHFAQAIIYLPEESKQRNNAADMLKKIAKFEKKK